jgi:hypothetical protein
MCLEIERQFLSCHRGESKEDYEILLRSINWRWIGFSEDDDKRIAEGANISRRSLSDVYQRVECKALWESRRVEGDGHVIATCGFTRPRSFAEDNAFRHVPGRQAMAEAEESGEV